jgi:rRNA maturation protein Nop10
MSEEYSRANEVDLHLPSYSNFEQAAIAIWQQLEKEDEFVEKARIAKDNKAIYFYRGMSTGLEENGEFTPLNTNDAETPREAALLLSDNVLRPQVRALMKEWSRSRTGLNIRGKNNTWKIQAGARWANLAIKTAQDRIFQESIRQTEGKYAILTGNFFRKTDFVKGGKRSPKLRIPIYEDRVVGEPHPECPTCMWADEPGTEYNYTGECPECGGELTMSKPVTASVQTGKYREVRVGDVQTILADTRSVKIPRATKKMVDHSYLRWRELGEFGTTQMRYRNIEIRPGIKEFDSIQILNTEAITSASEFGAIGRDISSENRVEINHVWLSPERYFWLNFPEDQKYYDLEIKANEYLGDQFPEGIYICIISEKLADAGEEDKASTWIHCAYDELFESPYGDGIDDAMSDQQRINEITGAQMEQVLFNSFGKIVVNTQLLDPSKLENDSAIVPMKPNVGTDIEPKKSFDVIQPPTLNEDTWLIRDQTERRMRDKTGAYLAMTGEGDESSGTATETAIMRDASVAMLGLALALRSEADVEWAFQVLEHYQKNWVEEYHSKMLGEYSVDEAHAFLELDIRNDLKVTIQANSWIPRTEDEEKRDFVEFLTAGGIPLGFANPQIPANVRLAAANLYRPPIDLDSIHPDIRITEKRISDLLRAGEHLPDEKEASEGDTLEEIEQMNQQLAIGLASQIPVRESVDDHAVMIDTYKQFLKKDEGIYAHKAIQDAVEILIMRHEAAGEQQGMQAAMAQGAMQSAATPQQPAEDKVAEQKGKPTAVSPEMPDSRTDKVQGGVPA